MGLVQLQGCVKCSRAGRNIDVYDIIEKKEKIVWKNGSCKWGNKIAIEAGNKTPFNCNTILSTAEKFRHLVHV